MSLIQTNQCLSKLCGGAKQKTMFDYVITPQLNWENHLIIGPYSLALLGELVLIAPMIKEMDLEDAIRVDEPQVLKYPTSIKFSLRQIGHKGWEATNIAHKNMNAIYHETQTIPSEFKKCLYTFIQGNEQDIARDLMASLKMVDTSVERCVSLTKESITGFETLIQMMVQLKSICCRKLGILKNEENEEVSDVKNNHSFNDLEEDLEKWQLESDELISCVHRALNSGTICETTVLVLSDAVIDTVRNNLSHLSLQNSVTDAGFYYFKYIMLRMVELLRSQLDNSNHDIPEVGQNVQVIELIAKYLEKQMESNATASGAGLRAISLVNGIIEVCDEIQKSQPPDQVYAGFQEITNKRIQRKLSRLLNRAHQFVVEADKAMKTIPLQPITPAIATLQSEFEGSVAMGNISLTATHFKLHAAKARLQQCKTEKMRAQKFLMQKNEDLFAMITSLENIYEPEVGLADLNELLDDGIVLFTEINQEWLKTIQAFQVIKLMISDLSHTPIFGNSDNLAGRSINAVKKDIQYGQVFYTFTLTQYMHTLSANCTRLAFDHIMPHVSKLGKLFGVSELAEIQEAKQDFMEQLQNTSEDIDEKCKFEYSTMISIIDGDLDCVKDLLQSAMFDGLKHVSSVILENVKIGLEASKQA